MGRRMTTCHRCGRDMESVVGGVANVTADGKPWCGCGKDQPMPDDLQTKTDDELSYLVATEVFGEKVPTGTKWCRDDYVWSRSAQAYYTDGSPSRSLEVDLWPPPYASDAMVTRVMERAIAGGFGIEIHGDSEADYPATRPVFTVTAALLDSPEDATEDNKLGRALAIALIRTMRAEKDAANRKDKA